MSIRTLTMVLGAIAAGFAFLPYPWAHATSGAIAAGIAALHGGHALANRPSKGRRTP